MSIPAVPPTGSVELSVKQSDVVVSIPPSPASPEPQKYFWTNLGVVGALTVAEVVTNRLIGNDAVLGSKANADGANLVSNYVYGNLISHIFKGNVRNVSSQGRQVLFLVGLPVGTLATDLAINGKMGEATVIAISITVNHACKSTAYLVIGRTPYNSEVPDRRLEDMTPAELRKRRAAAYAFQFFVTLGAGIAGKFVETGTGPSAILFQTYSAMDRKTRKAVLNITVDKKARYLHVAGLAATSLVASVLAGSVVPLASASSASAIEKTFEVCEHYFGATEAVDVTGAVTDGLPRAGQKPKTAAPAEGPKKKDSSLKKRIAHGVAMTCVVTAAAVTDHLNDTYWGSSSQVRLGIKLWLGGLLYHSTREALKGLEGIRRTVTQVGVVALGYGTQILANHIEGKSGNLAYGPVGAVVAGTAAAFFGKDRRNQLLPKPAHH